ncbi:MAG: hypothetical protein LBC18_02435, partial [Opitutaceae bacterium]|nr:hypothetical protein [Opitutaceae bacterium]
MPPLPAQLPIKPFAAPAAGAVALPGSKSLTNRALLLAALCDEPVTLAGALFSDDTRLMAEALRRLGIGIETDETAGAARVGGQENAPFKNTAAPARPVELFTGLAGTAARFLTALCAAAPAGVYRIDGVPQMRRRPMRGLIEALRALGAGIRCTGGEGFLPLEIRARGLRGGAVAIDARESSQLLSALLMVAPLAAAGTDITLHGGVRRPFVEMTARLMRQFGQPPLGRPAENRLRVAAGHPYRLPAAARGAYAIEPDATAASYFLALPLAAGGALAIPGLRPHEDGGLQGDTRFAAVLARAGATITAAATATADPATTAATAAAAADPGTAATAAAAGLAAAFDRGAPRRAVTENFNEISDTFLTLAAIAPLLDGVTRITGIGHTRRQETDRVAGAARELARLGQRVTETADSLEITPDKEKMRALSQAAPIVI